MNTRSLILPAILAAGLGSVYFLPSAGEVAQSAVRMNLPEIRDNWYFRHIPPSREETGTLSKDTEFSKAVCFSAREGEFDADGRVIPDRIDLSVVLSGVDINNSIHRPERCMPAQGHQIMESHDKRIELDNGKSLEVRRLRSIQRIPTNEDRSEFLELNCVTYYFFVGHDTITNDHLDRTLIDMKDRLLKGMDQRWAYVSTSMWFGKLPWIEAEVGEKEVDQKLTEFMEGFAESQIDWEQIAP
jgi:hypothetical protein